MSDVDEEIRLDVHWIAKNGAPTTDPCVACEKRTRSHVLVEIDETIRLLDDRRVDVDALLNGFEGEEISFGLICHSCLGETEFPLHNENREEFIDETAFPVFSGVVG